MTLIGDYNHEFDIYQKKYGEKTMFLMQCGSFLKFIHVKKVVCF